jgi:hypothetical protein
VLEGGVPEVERLVQEVEADHVAAAVAARDQVPGVEHVVDERPAVRRERPGPEVVLGLEGAGGVGG